MQAAGGAAVGLAAGSVAHASEEEHGLAPANYPWSHEGPMSSFDAAGCANAHPITNPQTMALCFGVGGTGVGVHVDVDVGFLGLIRGEDVRVEVPAMLGVPMRRSRRSIRDMRRWVNNASSEKTRLTERL